MSSAMSSASAGGKSLFPTAVARVDVGLERAVRLDDGADRAGGRLAASAAISASVVASAAMV